MNDPDQTHLVGVYGNPMTSPLKVSVGQFSDKGRKESNQDFHGFCSPKEPMLSLKGLAFVMADGISSSDVSHIASETAVKSFLDDYFCTSDAWSVRHSVSRVLSATNSWLYSQSQNSPYRYDKDKGYVCTLSALVIKATTVHIFHVGDTRIYKLHGNALEQLTNDHRLWVSKEKSYLSRALGIEAHIEIDEHVMPANIGDIFILATDGVYEHIEAQVLINTINENINDLDAAAKSIINHAYDQGSLDNLTLQIIRIEDLPQQKSNELQEQIDELSLPPILEPRTDFDGYTIIREVHATSRSHVYLALDQETNTQVIIKTPSIDLRGDPAYLERFLMEEWVARRINSAHVLKAGLQTRKRHYLYTVNEFIDGQTLKQWIIDNPKPDIETVRNIVGQIIMGLRALHRMDILHQDIRPDNIMIDHSGTVKIIDFGSTRIAGIADVASPIERKKLLGTREYTAPLGVLTYHMLSGKFPYGTQVSKCRTAAAQRKLTYISVLDDEQEIPAWIDDALKKAVHPNPYKRYQALSEFIFDLRHPNKAFLNKTRPALIERNPVQFWKGISALLAAIVIVLLVK